MYTEPTKLDLIRRVLLLVSAIALTGCNSTRATTPTLQADLSTPTLPATAVPLPSLTTEALSTPPDEILEAIVPRECWVATDAQAFWIGDQGDGDDARFTVSAETLQTYLSDMGISAICVPPELGALYLNVDWNSADLGHVTGRMLSLGFTDLYAGSGWGEGYLVYATYDFAAGTEYDVFAGYEDWLSVAEGGLQDAEPIEVDGVRGFMRFQRGLGYGSCPVYRTIVFPFEAHYVAIVQALGQYGGDVDWDDLVVQLRQGDFPPTWQAPMAAMDALAQSLQFIR